MLGFRACSSCWLRCHCYLGASAAMALSPRATTAEVTRHAVPVIGVSVRRRLPEKTSTEDAANTIADARWRASFSAPHHVWRRLWVRATHSRSKPATWPRSQAMPRGDAAAGSRSRWCCSRAGRAIRRRGERRVRRFAGVRRALAGWCDPSTGGCPSPCHSGSDSGGCWWRDCRHAEYAAQGLPRSA